MPKRDRRDRSALVALALFAIWFLVLGFLGLANSYVAHYEAQDGWNQHYQGSNEDIRAILAAIDTFDPLQDSIAQWVMAIFAALATGVSVGAVWLVWRTWKEAERTADAAVDANETARKALEADQRPWLSFDNAVVRHIEINETGWVVGIKVDVKNVGKSPATDVRLHMAFYRSSPRTDSPVTLDDFCEQCIAKGNPDDRNRIFFPGQGDTLYRATNHDLSPTSDGIIYGVNVLFCVTYRSHLLDETRHIGSRFSAVVKPVRLLREDVAVITSDNIEIVAANQYASMS